MGKSVLAPQSLHFPTAEALLYPVAAGRSSKFCTAVSLASVGSASGSDWHLPFFVLANLLVWMWNRWFPEPEEECGMLRCGEPNRARLHESRLPLQKPLCLVSDLIIKVL